VTDYWTPLSLIVGILGASFFAASFILEMRTRPRPKLAVLFYLIGAFSFFTLIVGFAFDAMTNG